MFNKVDKVYVLLDCFNEWFMNIQNQYWQVPILNVGCTIFRHSDDLDGCFLTASTSTTKEDTAQT